MPWKTFDDSYSNAKLIFPTKQREVGKIIAICKEDPNIKRITVFGSSVTSACNPWSDIDVYFELERPVANLPVFGLESAVDKWDNYNVSDELLMEIQKRGVVVYER